MSMAPIYIKNMNIITNTKFETIRFSIQSIISPIKRSIWTTDWPLDIGTGAIYHDLRTNAIWCPIPY